MPDTLNILELELKMESMIEKSDTVIFYFNFIDVANNCDTLIYQSLTNDLTSCVYNGIAVKKSDNQVFPTVLGEQNSIIDTAFVHHSQKNFKKCLLNNKHNLSKTLRYLLGNHDK